MIINIVPTEVVVNIICGEPTMFDYISSAIGIIGLILSWIMYRSHRNGKK